MKPPILLHTKRPLKAEVRGELVCRLLLSLPTSSSPLEVKSSPDATRLIPADNHWVKIGSLFFSMYMNGITKK